MWPFSESYPESSCEAVVETEWDYIIVGGGTSGCVIANRLSEEPGVKVLLVERGRAANTWLSRVPLLSTNFVAGKSRSFSFPSEPVAQFDGRPTEIVGGRALGGTSRINSMMYTRGIPAEYNAWANSGLEGWSYHELLPYFLKSQNSIESKYSEFHSDLGEWQVRAHTDYFFPSTARQVETPLLLAGRPHIERHSVIKAAKSLGLPFYDDLNLPMRPVVGCSKTHFTIDSEGQRHSTFHAFLPLSIAMSRRDRLTICTSTIARRLDIKSTPDGNLRVEGVFLQSVKPGSSATYVRARREVIVASGALGSPCLLMLSGVGPCAHLQELGIPVLKDLPGVGSNLQDHVGLSTEYSVPMDESLLGLLKRPLSFLRALWKYVTKGRGLLISPIAEVSIFARTALLAPGGVTVNSEDTDSSDPAHLPDFEVMPTPIADPRPPEFDRSKGTFAFTIAILRPKSRGSVRLSSSDPLEHPVCDMNYFASPEDWVNMRAAITLAVRLSQCMRESGYPIEDVHVPDISDDADIDKFIKEYGRSLYHYTSTCRMGDENDTFPGVVDAQLRVHGIRGLRVADASVFPTVPATHTQAPAVVVAEKCADMVKKQWAHIQRI
ncbi:GMC oxidoreductase [Gautieria morchelliformis]|nr:GMC oxidoreductase [Gautieria morchelliformis]